MAEVLGGVLLGRTLKAMGVDTIFYLRGGPMSETYETCAELGIRMIDVRHEQAAAMMAHAYSRIARCPGVCMAGAGVDTLNLATGIATAVTDCSPVVAICGAASLRTHAMDAFQDVDQFDVMKPITKRAWRVPIPEKIPTFVSMAFRHAMANRPGPVYLELPANICSGRVEESEMETADPPIRQRPMGDPEYVKRAIEMLSRAEKPIIISGDGVLWSDASAELREFVDLSGIPFYTTPLTRGMVPDDHPLSFPGARAAAWRETDTILVVGARPSFILFSLQPPQVSAKAKVIMVNIDAEEIGHNRHVDLGIQGDAKAVLKQLIQEGRGRFDGNRLKPWLARLKEVDQKRQAEVQPSLNSDQKPIHPLRLCREISDFKPRDSILVIDGNETLHFARQSIPVHYPGQVLNPGVSGCMGVGVPYGIGAKAARPDKPVLVFTGDGAFGFNGMEMDVAVRHKLPIVVVINNNGGWSAADPDSQITGRDLGFTRYDKIAEALGGYGELVDEPKDIRGALERATASGKPAVVNVITDPYCGATRQAFALDRGKGKGRAGGIE
ncbi:MAG: thiamine pyrophosphate-binding protein [Chloroflexi bacterium]|nr:thiamine pyrophosphate-binding protein [Chloroflexota bacterium]